MSWFGFVSGYVYDTLTPNLKIAGATITVDGVEGSAITTSQGLYIKALAGGTYILRASATGYGQGMGTATVGGINITPLDIGITPILGKISGQISSLTTSKVQNGIVELHTDLNSLQKGLSLYRIKVNRNGAFSLNVRAGSYYLKGKTHSQEGPEEGYHSLTAPIVVASGANITGCGILLEKKTRN